MNERLTLNDHTLTITHPDRIYFPDAGLQKRDLVGYYRRIAPVMLPHLHGRPLSLQRFPEGINGEGFYQKEAPDHFPDWISRVMVPVKREGDAQPQVLCEDTATLIYLANQGCITMHGWLSRGDALHRPDRLCFDLDPPNDAFAPVRAAAQALHDALDEAGLIPFVMTTGSRGLHVVAPLKGETDFDAVRAFARRLAEQLARQEPDRFTTEIRKDARQGRLFLDYLRNAYAQTTVVPYAVRALPGAPVAAPLDWAELDRADLHAGKYTIENIFHRMGQKEDPWAEIGRHGRPLPE